MKWAKASKGNAKKRCLWQYWTAVLGCACIFSTAMLHTLYEVMASIENNNGILGTQEVKDQLDG
jgi:hypothetical protein